MVRRQLPPTGDRETVIEALEGLSQKALLEGDAWTARLLISTAELLAIALKSNGPATGISTASASDADNGAHGEVVSLYGLSH